MGFNMKKDSSKVMKLSEAIRRFVADGSHISIGGFTINRNPMAAVYEMIRRKKRGLHLYAHSNGQGVDELVGAGVVSCGITQVSLTRPDSGWWLNQFQWLNQFHWFFAGIVFL